MSALLDGKEKILSLLDRPIAFHRAYVPVAGSVAGAVWLSQLVYWTGRGSDPDGWIYKVQEEWTLETGLSRFEQEAVRRSLRAAGVLEESKRGIPAKLFYKLNLQKLAVVLGFKTKKPRVGKGSHKDAEKSQPSKEKTSKHAGGKLADKPDNKKQSNIKSSSKSSQKLPPLDGGDSTSKQTALAIDWPPSVEQEDRDQILQAAEQIADPQCDIQAALDEMRAQLAAGKAVSTPAGWIIARLKEGLHTTPTGRRYAKARSAAKMPAPPKEDDGNKSNNANSKDLWERWDKMDDKQQAAAMEELLQFAVSTSNTFLIAQIEKGRVTANILHNVFLMLEKSR